MSTSDDKSVKLSLFGEELVLRDRYEVASIANDVVIAIWFAVGSVLFFWESTNTWGIWCFLLGSIQLGIRPMIRLARLVDLRRRSSDDARRDDGFEY